MAVKSIIDIDVRDERFDAFLKLFNRYQAAVKKVPDDWARQDKIIAATRKRFDKMTDAMRKQDDLTKDVTERKERSEKVSSERWEKINKQSGGFLRNVTRATQQLLKWGSITAAFGGLLGAGGLFGAGRLAGSIAGGRRASLGLGTTFGEQRAFEVNYGRLVDTASILSGVNEALHDVTTRPFLAAAGVSGATIAGGNSAQVAKELLVQMKRLADHTDPTTYGQQISALGLNNLGITVEDLVRLRGTSASEFSDIQKRGERDIRTFALVQETQRAWQDLDVQLTRAGATVENSFAKGLKDVVGPLEHLSDATAKAVRAFLSSDNAKLAIEGLAKGITFLGDYMASPDFKKAVVDFGRGVVDLARVLGDAYRRLTGQPTQSESLHDQAERILKKRRALADGTFVGPLTPEEQQMRRDVPWWLGGPSHNPGNLKHPGGIGFQHFDSDEEGLRALRDQLLRNETLHGQDTLRKLIYGSDKWPGYSTTDREAYLRNLVRGVGIAPDAQLDPTNKDQLSHIMSVITKQEGKSYYPPGAVKVIIENQTGGSAVVQSSQIAQ